MNFHLGWEKGDEPLCEVGLTNLKTGEKFDDKVRMFFIDLKAFKKTDEEQCENDFERWIYSLKYMNTMTETPKIAKRKSLMTFYNEAEYAALSPRARARYDEDLKNYRDRIMDQETRRLEKKRARAEGLAEGKTESARNMKLAGIATELIIQCTGLTEEDISRL